MSGASNRNSSTLHTAEVRRQLSSARRWILVMAAVVVGLPVGAAIQLSIFLQLATVAYEEHDAFGAFIGTLVATGPLAFVGFLALLYYRRVGYYLKVPSDEELFFVSRAYKRFWLWVAFVFLAILGIPLLGIAGSLVITLITGDGR